MSVLLADACLATVGFQQATVPDRNGKAMQAGIWYPSNVQTAAHPLGLFMQDVALNGPIDGQALPIVLISHGTGGSLSSHLDTANALARAGFVVLASASTAPPFTAASTRRSATFSR